MADRALVVGLTGGIASGKSTVSRRLVGLGATVVDYDLLAREVVAPGRPALAAIAERFGPDVIAADGTLDRPALGAIVFADEGARRDLEAITHPAIRELAHGVTVSAAPGTIVVHDNPLLVEMGGHRACDVVIVVDADEDAQIARMVRDRNLTEDEARARLAAQTSRAARRAVADIVIENDGPLDALMAKVDSVWAELVSRTP